ncbi:hypothetical protein PVAP13_7NG192717 [Panicum virgatum]|uniref:Uncharacterized protein n=1 Tax=Panicum virgatum TaxID=38727 RepID=A0A8T0Q5Y1_PANVG|nr:hypothetical protein PVAP13_7NG192717 [Panicum virgatum]
MQKHFCLPNCYCTREAAPPTEEAHAGGNLPSRREAKQNCIVSLLKRIRRGAGVQPPRLRAAARNRPRPRRHGRPVRRHGLPAAMAAPSAAMASASRGFDAVRASAKTERRREGGRGGGRRAMVFTRRRRRWPSGWRGAVVEGERREGGRKWGAPARELELELGHATWPSRGDGGGGRRGGGARWRRREERGRPEVGRADEGARARAGSCAMAGARWPPRPPPWPPPRADSREGGRGGGRRAMAFARRRRRWPSGSGGGGIRPHRPRGGMGSRGRRDPPAPAPWRDGEQAAAAGSARTGATKEEEVAVGEQGVAGSACTGPAARTGGEIRLRTAEEEVAVGVQGRWDGVQAACGIGRKGRRRAPGEGAEEVRRWGGRTGGE